MSSNLATGFFYRHLIYEQLLLLCTLYTITWLTFEILKIDYLTTRTEFRLIKDIKRYFKLGTQWLRRL
jgi:hypothetical protein